MGSSDAAGCPGDVLRRRLARNVAENADVAQVLNQHPHQVLKPEHFAAIHVNWEPKTENLVALAEELNLDLDSFIFVDDSDYECALVRRELPEVEIIQTPSRPVEIPYCLDQVSRLELLSLTAEDLKKTEMYAQEGLRRQLEVREQLAPVTRSPEGDSDLHGRRRPH